MPIYFTFACIRYINALLSVSFIAEMVLFISDPYVCNTFPLPFCVCVLIPCMLKACTQCIKNGSKRLLTECLYVMRTENVLRIDLRGSERLERDSSSTEINMEA